MIAKQWPLSTSYNIQESIVISSLIIGMYRSKIRLSQRVRDIFSILNMKDLYYLSYNNRKSLRPYLNFILLWDLLPIKHNVNPFGTEIVSYSEPSYFVLKHNIILYNIIILLRMGST